MLGSGCTSALVASVLSDSVVGVVWAGATAPGKGKEGSRESDVVMEDMGDVRIPDWRREGEKSTRSRGG